MAIGGERMNASLPDIQREGSKSLNRVDEEQAAVAVADFADGLQVGPKSAQVLYEADRKESCPLCGGSRRPA